MSCFSQGRSTSCGFWLEYHSSWTDHEGTRIHRYSSNSIPINTTNKILFMQVGNPIILPCLLMCQWAVQYSLSFLKPYSTSRQCLPLFVTLRVSPETILFLKWMKTAGMLSWISISRFISHPLISKKNYILIYEIGNIFCNSSSSCCHGGWKDSLG